MTDCFDNIFDNILENLSLPQDVYLSFLEGYFANDESVKRLVHKTVPQDQVDVRDLRDATCAITVTKKYAWDLMNAIKRMGFSLIYHDNTKDGSISVVVLSKSDAIRDSFFKNNKGYLNNFVPFR